MPRSRRLIPLLLTALALAASGCGGADKGKITAAQASRLDSSLDRAETTFGDDQCGDARAAAQTGAQRASALKGNVDDDLRDNLVQGFEHLEQRIAGECNEPEKTSTPTPTATVEPTVTETPTATATPSPTPTATATATPTPTATVEPTVTATPDNGTGGTGTDDDSGGSEAP